MDITTPPETTTVTVRHEPTRVEVVQRGYTTVYEPVLDEDGGGFVGSVRISTAVTAHVQRLGRCDATDREGAVAELSQVVLNQVIPQAHAIRLGAWEPTTGEFAVEAL